MELDLMPKENQYYLLPDNPSFAIGKLCQERESKC
jgi:hypothetical protein